MLPWDLFTISKMEFFGQVNFLKGALAFSDYVTTVSKKYSQEIQTTEYGFGLEGVLRDRAATVTGILNGVDYDEWSPEAGKFIADEVLACGLKRKRPRTSRICCDLWHHQSRCQAAGDRHRLALCGAKRLRSHRPDHGPARARGHDSGRFSAPATRNTKRCSCACRNSSRTRSR